MSAPNTTVPDDAVLSALCAVVGPEHVLTAATHDLTAWEQDWRRRHRGRARAVVRPADTAQVAAVVRTCAAHGVPIVPQGGNTGLVLGGVPDASGTEVVLSLQRLQRVRALDRDNLTLTVEAGCVLQAAQQAAADAGLWLPLSLASEGSCTVGGVLATNAGGTQVLRFGNARDLCLGLEVVTADGRICNGLRGLRKDNTGYDLRHLLIGSEGTLGIITAAVLKLAPQPAAQLTAWASVPSLAAAVALLGMAQRHLGPALTGFEVMNRLALQLVQRHFAELPMPLPGDAAPYAVLLELSDAEGEDHARARLEAVLAHALQQGCALDAVVATNLTQARTLWHIRECIPLAQAQEGLNVKHDISLPVSRIPAFCAEAEAALQRRVPGARLVNFGHLGDGNLHFNVQCPPGADAAAFLQAHEATINTLVYDLVHAHGGSISAEHGIGRLKAATLPRYQDPVALALMRAIKQALDPQHLLNPGRVLVDR
ncbi:FAD-binding oxidoreductase [Tepidimonas aquatica]|uniref:Putative FAD-linked oxidoreductase n=1 Tax=Tepidimonas aquatica TaxID=247482 RepID=A0A554WR15_9BURK|nr:FAD-binding oxidoreductase [Tepidimonas aquatica]TSE26018.1 putative FAD-linked oxidoreductase [Tepidimonas aquatica]